MEGGGWEEEGSGGSRPCRLRLEATHSVSAIDSTIDPIVQTTNFVKINNCVKIPDVYVRIHPSAVRFDLGSEVFFTIESWSENPICKLHVISWSLVTPSGI